MACARSGFLSITHQRTPVIVFVGHRSRFLWNVEVPKDTANKQAHLPDIASRHEFRLSGREGHRGLEFSFVGNCPTSKLDANTAEGTVSFYTSGPIRVPVSHGNVSIMSWAAIKQEILGITVDGRERSSWQLVPRAGSPKVDPVMSRDLNVADGVFQAVVVVFSGSRVGL
jgi:hypothetical protein